MMVLVWKSPDDSPNLLFGIASGMALIIYPLPDCETTSVFIDTLASQEKSKIIVNKHINNFTLPYHHT